MSAKLVELIETETLRGTGKGNDVFRRVNQWWSKAGDLVVEKDEWQESVMVAELSQAQQEIDALHGILDEQLGKEREPVGLRTRVLAAAIGCKKWLEHEAQQSIAEAGKRLQGDLNLMCCKRGCCNVRQLYGDGNYSVLCRFHNDLNAKRQRDAREESKRRTKK
jgi:hypothetical protein